MGKHHYIPSAIFDTLDVIIEQFAEFSSAENPRHAARQWLNACFTESNTTLPVYASQDYLLATQFLMSYRGSQDTFTAYRREIEVRPERLRFGSNLHFIVYLKHNSSYFTVAV